jgi:hypothetical protein
MRKMNARWPTNVRTQDKARKCETIGSRRRHFGFDPAGPWLSETTYMADHRATTRHRCHACGATSYKSVIDRDEQGAMRPTGRYRCTGCEVVFSSPQAWRDGDAASQSPEQAAHVERQRGVSMAR